MKKTTKTQIKTTSFTMADVKRNRGVTNKQIVDAYKAIQKDSDKLKKKDYAETSTAESWNNTFDMIDDLLAKLSARCLDNLATK